MPEYKISKVSAGPPKAWSFKDKKTGNDIPMETYKVMLEGIDEPVDLSRKPGNLPKVDELLLGTIEPTDFGQRFKAERKPYTPGAGFSPKDQDGIRAQWAIGQAQEWAKAAQESGDNGIMANWNERVEYQAKELFHMVSRVKTSKLTAQAVFADGTPVPTSDDGMIDISDIPF